MGRAFVGLVRSGGDLATADGILLLPGLLSPAAHRTWTGLTAAAVRHAARRPPPLGGVAFPRFAVTLRPGESHGPGSPDPGFPEKIVEVDMESREPVLLGLRGLLALAFGVLVLVWPGVTLLALALVFAAYVIVDGVGMVASGLTAGPDRRRRWSYVLAGLLGILAGILAAVWPAITVLGLVLLAGAWAVVRGALEISAAVRGRDDRSARWIHGLVGVLSIIAGVIIFARPGIGALALATVLAVYALVAGATLLAAAWQVRSGRRVPVDARP